MHGLAAIPDPIVRRRAAPNRAAPLACVAVPLACAASALCVDDWRARRFPAAHVAPFFIAFRSLLTTRDAWYRAPVVLLLAVTAYFKLMVWSDPRWFMPGIVLALAFAALHRRVAT